MQVNLQKSRSEQYPAGSRVRLIAFAEDEGWRETLPAGTEGTVRYVDSLGTVHIDWDNGSRLGALTEDTIIKI